MSGLELVGTVLAGLEAAISIVSAIRDAVQYAKELRALLDECKEECYMSKTIVEAVQSQQALQRRDVLLTVVKMGTAITAIDGLLSTLDKDRKPFHEIGHQLISGAQERKKLRKLMDRLIRAKNNLSVIITVINSQPAAAVSRRIVKYNKSSDNARQFNAPVVQGGRGGDPWKDIREVIIENNEASGKSVQLNIAMTTGDLEMAFKILAENEEREVRAELEQDFNGGAV